MTDSGPVVVRQGGVVVEKSYDPEGYPVPTIEYGLRSERDDPVEVRLADTVPDDVPMEDIGFHPEYGAECWTTTSDGRIVFEREFDPDEEYITVCGLRPEHTDEIDRFLTEPVVEAEAAPGTVADAERGGADADTSSGDTVDAESHSIEVESDGIDIEKCSLPEASVPGIAFVVRSERDDPAEVRLVEDIPDDVSTERVLFHQEYGAEFWTVAGDDRLVFEREFEPGEEYTAVYGVQDEPPGDIDRFLTEPTVETGPAPERSGPDDGHEGTDANADSNDTVDPELHPIEIERGGVTVEKFFEPDEFPVPTIVFVVRSERDGPAAVRLVDSIPDGIPIEDIGFHPEYGDEFWTAAADDRIVFEREFAADEEYTTVYGVRASDPSDIERLLTEPSIEVVGEPRPGSESAVTQDSDHIAAAADGDAEVAADGEDPSVVGADGGNATTDAGEDHPPEHGTGPRVAPEGAGMFDGGPVTGSEEYTDSIDASYDEFEHVEPLGGGGFADVRLATYEGREVALKVPRFGTDATLSRDLVDRFVEEAEYWTAVDDHPNVVTVLDHGLHGGLPWLALEYVPDGDLSTVVGDLSVGEAATVGVGIARAVRYAHRHSVSHLDLKPGNVLLDATGEVPTPKVTDWGLSRTLLDETGTMEGLSVAYAAPEQFEGGSPDDFTDIYQLGALLFELFTGEPPYDGPPMAVLREKGDEPPRPTAVDPSLPAAVDEIVGRAMAAAKTDRYETVVDLRRDLAALRDRA